VLVLISTSTAVRDHGGEQKANRNNPEFNNPSNRKKIKAILKANRNKTDISAFPVLRPKRWLPCARPSKLSHAQVCPQAELKTSFPVK
jgi:hypothetical protein